MHHNVDKEQSEVDIVRFITKKAIVSTYQADHSQKNG
jgi:hypothetical protein